jgi:hypothetical protein
MQQLLDRLEIAVAEAHDSAEKAHALRLDAAKQIKRLHRQSEQIEWERQRADGIVRDQFAFVLALRRHPQYRGWAVVPPRERA